jgi:predicted deacylase
MPVVCVERRKELLGHWSEKTFCGFTELTSQAPAITIDPSTKRFELVKVAVMGDGGELSIPVHILGGARPGPKLCLAAFTHGYDATFVVDAFKEIVEKTNVNDLSGSLIVLPVCNPNAYEWRLRFTPVDVFGDSGGFTADMNRVFPGNINGNLSEKIAWTLSECILKNMDCIIDFHTADRYCVNMSKMVLVPGLKTSQRVQELSEIFGLKTIAVSESGPRLIGSMGEWASRIGIPVIVPEVGTEYFNVMENIEVAVRGVQNIMKHLGMIQGSPVLPKELYVVKSEYRTWFRARHGGLFRPETRTHGLELAGTIVRGKGKRLARTFSPYTFEEVDRVEAPYEENLMINVRAWSEVLPGEQLYSIGDAARSRQRRE